MTRIEEEYSVRKQKLHAMREAGIDPYPARTNQTITIETLRATFNSEQKNAPAVTVVGRIRAIRLHGGSCFMNIDDATASIQLYAKRDVLNAEQYDQLIAYLDVGDFVVATGTPFSTKRGEQSLLLSNAKIISKALLPLPEKWHGLSDIEVRYRKRYLDLIANPGIKNTFRKRAIIISTIRSFLDAAGFLEVETPILQPIPGGANAAPFITHHNALGTDLYLRIAPELYLKRLIIGGFNKVFEVSRCFRNEGIDKSHNPEFTQIELYAAYWDYEQLMVFTEQLFKEVVTKTTGSGSIEYEGQSIDFSKPFKRLTFVDACISYAAINISDLTDKALLHAARKKKIDVPQQASRAKIIDEIFKECIRPHLIQPTFIIDHPIELSPLAKKKIDNPKFVERFQLVCAGFELCNAFSELNDPLDQEERFQYQEKMRTAGDTEAQRIDTDFLEALSYGMPPTAGIGIGIDRLTVLLANVHTIKEALLFPMLKPTPNDEPHSK